MGYLSNLRITRGQALYTTTFTPPTGPLQPIQGTTQAGLPYGTVLLLRNAPAPGRIQTTKFSGANSGQVLSFPPAAMTTYAVSLNAGYGQGTYVASASSENTAGGGYYSYRAFDKGASTVPYSATGSLYAASGAYTGTVRSVDVNGTSYSGEWLQIQMPSSVVLSSYSLQQRQDGYGNGNGEPTSWTILGSNDGTNWSVVDQRTFTAWAGSATFFTFTVASQRSFSFYRFVGSTVGSSAGTNNLCFAEWTLNGSIESVNVTADGRVGLGVVNPTRALEVAGDIVCTGTVSSGTPTMFKNQLINGDMRIMQRGAPGANLGGSSLGVYTLDRWWVTQSTTASNQISQVASGLPGFQYAVRIQRPNASSSTTFIALGQSIETVNTIPMQGQPMTISFWARNGAGYTGSITLFVIYGTGTDQSPYLTASSLSGWTGQTTIISPIVPTTSNWTQFSYQFFLPAAATEYEVIFSRVPSGTAGTTDYLDITGVQLEKGSVATPYEILPYATELALCQRYYYRLTSATGANYMVFGTGSFIGSTTVAQVYIPYPVTMRATAPGANFSNSAPSTFWFGTLGQPATAIAQVGGTEGLNGNQVTFTQAATVTAGTGAIIEANSSYNTFLAFSAEL